MRAYHAGGNAPAVRSTMARLTSVLERDIEPLESLRPETLALYDSLATPRSPRHPPGGLASGRVARRER
jgi:hypothetical protein